MGWWRRIAFLLRPFRSRSRVHRDIDDEIEFHVDMQAQMYARQGLAPAEARRRARIEFGGIDRYREEVGDVDGIGWIERLLTDLRYGFRVLRKSPVFTGVAILTLGLGIGASTAIFSVVDGIMLRSLPFPDSDRLVSIWSDQSRRGGPVKEWLSWPNFYDARAHDQVFESAGTYLGWGPTLTGSGDATTLLGSQVSEGFLSDVLGVEPAQGRGFTADDQVPGAPAVLLISHGLWQRQFGGDPSVVGRTISLSDEPYTIIGIMPPGFRQPFNEQAEMWAPMQWNETTFGGGRGSAILRAVGRLQPEVELATAQTEMAALGARLEQTYAEANTGVGYAIYDLRSDLVSTASAALWVLLGAVGFVLLIVCVNLANLQLARGVARRSELAARTALGAPQGRLVRQLLTENVLLAMIGGAVGIGLAFALTGLVVDMAPSGVPRLHEVGVNGRVLSFALLATLFTGVAFGLWPAVQGARTDLRDALHEGGRAGSAGSRSARGRRGLIAAQMALALVLLVGAGLFLRSFRALSQVDLGYDAAGVVTFAVNLPPSRYEREDLAPFLNDLEARVGALPGVTSVGSVSTIPLSGFDSDSGFRIEGRPPPLPGQDRAAWIRRTTPGYFETMGIRMVSGRAFEARDADQAPPVVIINQSMADQFFAEQNPLGQRINVNNPEEPIWREIVGVVSDVKNFGVRSGERIALYFPHDQLPTRNMSVAARTSGDATAVVPFVRRAVAELDPAVAVTVTAMSDLVDQALAPDRFIATLLSAFALVALILAAVGLLGIVSYGVSQRMREMGIRVALGAKGWEIAGMVVKDSLVLAAVGIGVGIVGAAFLTRFASSLLFGIEPTDPLTFATVALLLMGVAAAGAALPAWRAAKVDPVEVLKGE